MDGINFGDTAGFSIDRGGDVWGEDGGLGGLDGPADDWGNGNGFYDTSGLPTGFDRYVDPSNDPSTGDAKLIPVKNDQSTPGGAALPPGCAPYTQEGVQPGQMMKCPNGLQLTPQRQNQVDHGTINWGGVAWDMGRIVGGSLAGIGAGVAGIVGGMMGTATDLIAKPGDGKN